MKKKLRKKFSSKRDLLSGIKIFEKSQKIKEKLFSLNEFKKAKTIFTYVSFKSEARTNEIISDSLKKKKKIAVPIVSLRGKKMLLSEIKSLNELEPSKIGLFQPREEFVRLMDKKKIDLVLVPGIAFDLNGNRIGSGKGFYDRFLSKISKKIPIIGLAFEEQITKKVPREKHDVRMHKIVTDKRIIECKKR